MSEYTYVLDIKEDENGEQYIELTDEMLEKIGWKIGDELVYTETEDGKVMLTKVDREEKKDDSDDSGN